MEDELTLCGQHDGITELRTHIECEQHIPGRLVVVYLPYDDDSSKYWLTICEIEVYATS